MASLQRIDVVHNSFGRLDTAQRTGQVRDDAEAPMVIVVHRNNYKFFVQNKPLFLPILLFLIFLIIF